jgi:hypothetical protein
MPALIIFGSVAQGASGDKGTAGEAVRVTEDAESVVRKLSQTKTGFSVFETPGRSSRKVWVNRMQVRMVRELAERSAKK